MKQYPFLASRIFDTPLLIEPGKLRVIVDAIGDRIGVAAEDPAPRMQEIGDGGHSVANEQETGRVAVIPLMGVTLARGGYMDAMSGVTSYGRLRSAVATALADDAVENILFDVSSPGGEVELCGETAAYIRQANAIKPITAIAHDCIASAAYWLASAAGEIVATRSSELGSLGVTRTHKSYEGAVEQAGVKITHIYAGAHKVDFSPYHDLSEDARKQAQIRVDDLYDQFTGSVAEYRGISQDAVKATEARMFGAEQAVALGLADRIDTYDNVLLQLQRGTAASTEGFVMPNASTEITTVAQLRENFPALCAEVDQTHETATGLAVETAVSAERERIAAVQDHAEAEGREPLARQLAFTPGMTAEAAGPILASAAKEPVTTVAEGPTPLDVAMVGQDPKVPSEAAAENTDPDAQFDAFLDSMGIGNNPAVAG